MAPNPQSPSPSRLRNGPRNFRVESNPRLRQSGVLYGPDSLLPYSGAELGTHRVCSGCKVVESLDYWFVAKMTGRRNSIDQL